MASSISLPEPGMISMIDDDNAFLMVKEGKQNLHALLKKGVATIASNFSEFRKFDHPYTFSIFAADNQATIKGKKFNKTSLAEIKEVYQDIASIRSADSPLLMVVNGKMMAHRGDLSSHKMQALIGKAIQKG